MMKKLHVLIIRNAYQKDAGGAEQYALNIAIALKNSGHQPILVTKVSKIQEKAKDHKIKYINGVWHDSQTWNRFYYLRYIFTTIWYIFIIVRNRIDIVHPMSRDDFVFATNAGSILNKRVTWTDHADLKYVLDNVNHYNPRMRNWIINASKKTIAITCGSYADLQAIKAVAPDLPPVILIHNGVFIPTNIKPVEKTNKIIIGTNARIVEDKGINELITGFANLKNPELDLWLLGGVSGNKLKYQSLAKKMGIDNHVVFWDYVAEPNDIVASMDIFVHASYNEAFSLAIIEAAMLGRPVIATRVGGTPEIIDSNCGILIEPRDSSAITLALRKLLDDKELREKLGDSARAKAIRDFNFQKIVDKKFIPLYLKS